MKRILIEFLFDIVDICVRLEIAIENVWPTGNKTAKLLTATRIIKFVQTKDYNNSELSFVGKALKQDGHGL